LTGKNLEKVTTASAHSMEESKDPGKRSAETDENPSKKQKGINLQDRSQLNQQF
jgi:hypothetical protein